jgi:hypothetical protein
VPERSTCFGNAHSFVDRFSNVLFCQLKRSTLFLKKIFPHSQVHGNSPGSNIPYRRAALFVPHSGHCPHFVSSGLAARGDYCRVPKKSGTAPSKNQELIQRKPLTEPPRNEEKFSPGTPPPRRHQHLIAMTLRKLRQTQRVKIQGKFVRLLDSNAYLTLLTQLAPVCGVCGTARAFVIVPFFMRFFKPFGV